MRMNRDDRVGYRCLLAFCLIYILVLTWMPFEFSAFNFHRRFQIGVAHWQDVALKFRSWDTINNIVLFIPFGFLLRGLKRKISRQPIWQVIKIILTGLAFSGLIECGQFFLDRTPSVFDLASNGVGTAFGLVLYECYVKAKRSSRIHRKHRMARPLFLSVALIYGLILAAILFYPSRLNSLSTWNPDYPLIVGDEATHDRPWRGEIGLIALYDKALSGSRIQSFFMQGLPGSREMRSDAIALYDFSEATGDAVHDRSKFSDPVDLVGKRIQRTLNPRSVRFGSAMIGQRKVQRIAERMMQSGQFSVEIWMRSANLTQSGPARIVSLSKNPDRRNWTLGQDRSNLIVRVRTPFAGPNGSRIVLTAPSVMDSVQFHHFVFTFHHGLERIYKDGTAGSKIIYADLFYLPLMLGIHNNPPSQAACMFLLWFPFGVLLTAGFGRERFWKAWFLSVFWSGAIELVFMAVFRQPFHPIFILLASVSAAFGVFAANCTFGSLNTGRSETV